jgi:hypothetical protein
LSVPFVWVGPENPNGDGEIEFKFDLTVAPETPSALRLGWHRNFVPGSADNGEAAPFGWLPLVLSGEEINWTAQINFVPLDPSGSARVAKPALPPDYYYSRHHEVVLRNDQGKIIFGPFLVREDSLKLSAQDVREAQSDGSTVDQALLMISTADPFRVYVVVRFDDLTGLPSTDAP